MILSNDQLNALLLRRNKALSMVSYAAGKGYKNAVINWTREVKTLEDRINAHLSKLHKFAMLKPGKTQIALLHRIETIKQMNNL